MLLPSSWLYSGLSSKKPLNTSRMMAATSRDGNLQEGQGRCNQVSEQGDIKDRATAGWASERWALQNGLSWCQCSPLPERRPDREARLRYFLALAGSCHFAAWAGVGVALWHGVRVFVLVSPMPCAALHSRRRPVWLCPLQLWSRRGVGVRGFRGAWRCGLRLITPLATTRAQWVPPHRGG